MLRARMTPWNNFCLDWDAQQVNTHRAQLEAEPLELLSDRRTRGADSSSRLQTYLVPVYRSTRVCKSCTFTRILNEHEQEELLLLVGAYM